MPGSSVAQPRISCVTPSYNQADYLDATLRSITTQGYENLEYIVIDGGSTDHSVEVIRRYEDDISFWSSEPDEGHAHALNKGFARTTGEIMCWLNSSDLYYPWTLATVAEIFTQLPEVQWITGVGSQFDVNGLPRVIASSSAVNIYDVVAGNYRWIQQESVFWRRSLWERAGSGLDQGLRAASDFDLWLRFFRHAPFYAADTLLGGFRVHDDRLGETADNTYEREAGLLFERFIASTHRRTLRRGRVIRWVRPARLGIVCEALVRSGILSWYRHPRIQFDFRQGVWVVR